MGAESPRKSSASLGFHEGRINSMLPGSRRCLVDLDESSDECLIPQLAGAQWWNTCVTDVVRDLERQGPCHQGAFIQAGRELGKMKWVGSGSEASAVSGERATRSSRRETWLDPERPWHWEEY